MRQPTPYGKAEDLALQNERLTQTLRRTRKALEDSRAETRIAQGQRDVYRDRPEAILESYAQWIDPGGYAHGLDAAIRGACRNYALQYRDHLQAQKKQEFDPGEMSDGFHTLNELYEARMLYHAHAVSNWEAAGIPVVKSVRHSNGELCFGGGWFIVVAELPGGQISQHYRMADWDLFDCYAVDIPPEFDGHTTQDTHQRLRDALGIEEA